jgi:hypothetical protein
VQFTLTNLRMGRALRTIVLQAPPRDIPSDMGPLTDDTTAPRLTEAPSFLGAFDPSSALTFRFKADEHGQPHDAFRVVDSAPRRAGHVLWRRHILTSCRSAARDRQDTIGSPVRCLRQLPRVRRHARHRRQRPARPDTRAQDLPPRLAGDSSRRIAGLRVPSTHPRPGAGVARHGGDRSQGAQVHRADATNRSPSPRWDR